MKRDLRQTSEEKTQKFRILTLVLHPTIKLQCFPLIGYIIPQVCKQWSE